jgi:plastocyanin
MRFRHGLAVLAGAALALPMGAAGAGSQPAAKVNAEGNPFTGGLKFNPAKVSVKVGQIVRWTNTDTVVPHTATENHQLWDLAGDYGKTPANPSGFGPGESRQRVFEAGTQHYYCRVHPTQMHGVVAVPVSLAVKNGPLKNGHPTRIVVMRWASAAPVKGEAFDVQVKRGSGKWKAFRSVTRDPSGKLSRQGSKIAISVRARLRKASDASAATGWSPVATVQA